MLFPIEGPKESEDLEKEKTLLLGLFLKERASFRLCRLLEEIPIPELISLYPYPEKELLSMAREELRRCEKLYARLLYFKEEAYPEALRVIPYKPPFLYVLGEIPEGPSIAVVGTRRPTPYGREVVEYFIPPLVRSGLGTVSGLARGIDTMVHRTTLREGGRTVAILGTGLDVIYPPENRDLYRAIVRSGSAIITEFPLGTRPRKEHFPRRNRIISGLSQGVFVVEAGRKSGTLITVKWGQDQGKDVFVCPGNIFSEQSAGTHYLLKNGAIPVTSPEDIIFHLGVEQSDKGLSLMEEPLEEGELSLPERTILNLLSAYPTHIEELLDQTGYELPQLLSYLSELELKGLIRSLPGKFYQRIYQV